jgi:hypothetical protein
MRRALIGFGAGICFLLGTLPGTAAAATIVGEAASSQTENIFCSPLEGVQDQSGAGANSYTVPADGVITKFRTYSMGGGDRSSDYAGGRDVSGPSRTDAIGNQLRLKTWRSTASPNGFIVAGASNAVTITHDGLNEFLTRVPVKAGDLLGITTLTDSFCAFNGVAGDAHRYLFVTDTAVGGTATMLSQATGNRWNIEATVEPDADRDGYGDETQDACPSDAATHGPCPAPETWIRFRPKFKHWDDSRFRFIASIEGSTFTCQMDDDPATACTSPVNYRRLKPGKHTFTVFATSPQGVADPTPEVVVFKVRKHR